MNKKQNINSIKSFIPFKGGLGLSRFFSPATTKILLLLTVVYGLRTTDSQAKDIFQTGLEQFEAKQYKEATTSFSAFLQKNPNDATALYNRGLSYYEADILDSAIADFSLVLSLNHQHINAKEKLLNALFKRAMAAYENEDLESALADFDEYLKLNPEDDVVLFNKGIIFSATDRKKEAVDEFTKAITINPKPVYYLNRALDYYLLKDYDKCLPDLNDVLKDNPEDTTSLWLREGICYEKKNYEAAKKDLEKLLQLKPDNRAVRDLYFTTSFSYYIEKNKYWALVLLALLIVGVFFSIRALMKRK